MTNSHDSDSLAFRVGQFETPCVMSFAVGNIEGSSQVLFFFF